MFNPIKSGEIVTAVGLAARAAASATASLDGFQRGQLLSAYSATRHLSVELEHYPAALDAFASSLARDLRAAPVVPGDAQLLSDAAAAVDASKDGPSLGAPLAGLLTALRQRGDREANLIVQLLHRRLRELAQMEVQILADHLE